MDFKGIEKLNPTDKKVANPTQNKRNRDKRD